MCSIDGGAARGLAAPLLPERKHSKIMIKIGINGFGRIGRLVFRAICDQGLLGKEIEVVAVNDLVPADNLAYLLKYDSIQGGFKKEVHSAKSGESVAEDDLLIVDGHTIKCLAIKEGPKAMPWKDLGARGKEEERQYLYFYLLDI